MAETATEPPPTTLPARQVVYCGICSLPPEYCEFGGTTKKCEEWLKAKHPSLHSKIYSADAAALAASLTTLSVSAQERADKDAAKKAAKAEALESREASKRATSKIVIKRVERNKRKFVTTVHGIEAFGLDLKKDGKGHGEQICNRGECHEGAGRWGGDYGARGC